MSDEFKATNERRGTGLIYEIEDVPYGSLVGIGPKVLSLSVRRLLHLEHPEWFQSAPEDQRSSNSCVANASVALAEALRAKKVGRWADLSRSFIYWESGVPRGWQGRDIGRFVRDAFWAMANTGVPLDSAMPFVTNDGQINVFTKPDARAYAQAQRNKLLKPIQIPREQVLAHVDAGYVVAFGFDVFEDLVFSSYAWETGHIKAPAVSKSSSSGHAMLITGFDREKRELVGANSWGTRWGRNSSIRPGWFRLDMGYLEDSNLSDDFWTAEDIQVSGL